MRKARIYVESKLEQGGRIRLSGEQARYLSRVLRLQAGSEFIVFDGRGGEYPARVESAARNALEARVGAFIAIERESPLKVTLVQGLSRSERMDFAVQKAVELGVHAIAPVTTERSVVRLDGDRRLRRVQHWRNIAVNACQQCGRTRLPRIEAIASLDEWLEKLFDPGMAAFVLAPDAGLTPAELGPLHRVALLVGGEGGFSDAEMGRITQSGFKPLALGPRILRTETAAVAALTVLQLIGGDLSPHS
jgi:16S rRNA (uracil1498-N3)-methyltransferase